MNPNTHTNLDSLNRLKYQARGFSFLPKQPINSALTGKHVSRLKGRGLNFEELRPYHFGDDIRTLDWKVTKRTGKPHVKVFNEERERNVFLLVDQRQNMFFGSTGKMKSVIAAEVAALVAWRVYDTKDRIGAVVFNDQHIYTRSPKRSARHSSQILSDIVKMNQQLGTGKVDAEQGVTLNLAFKKLLRMVNHDGLVILISDGRGWNDTSTEYVKKLRRHNDFIICHVTDPLERKLPPLKQMIFSDGDMQLQLSDQDEKTLEQYQDLISRQLEKLRLISCLYRIPIINFETLTDSATQLRKALGG